MILHSSVFMHEFCRLHTHPSIDTLRACHTHSRHWAGLELHCGYSFEYGTGFGSNSATTASFSARAVTKFPNGEWCPM